MKSRKKKYLLLIFRYALPYVLFDLAAVIFWGMGVISFFRAVFLIYITNFIVFPLLKICYALGKIAAKKLKRCDPGLLRNTRHLDNPGIHNTGVNIGCSLVLFAVFVYATLIEPHNIQVERRDIPSAKVAGEIKILHISDIQITSVGRYEQKVFHLMQDLKPDLVLHTGDLVQVIGHPQKREAELQKLTALFQQLAPQYGIYTVIGDTDGWMDSKKIRWFDERSGVTTLINANKIINTPQISLHLLGLSVARSRHGINAFVEHWQQTRPKEAFTIILGHAPDYILDILDLDIDLCLAGHTHGGQIRIPFFGPIITLSRVPRAWALGYREVNQLRMNVSAGIGAEHLSDLPSIRFNCPPTMTLFTVKPCRQ